MQNRDAFLALVRAGLWEVVNDNDNKNLFDDLDWVEVQKLAEEQSVIGLVAAGSAKQPTGILPLTEKLTLLGKCQLIEQRNEAMNRFTEALVKKLQEAGIKVLLVKGQGIAQCYAKPLRRTSGDIDLFFSKEDYPKAVELLSPLASNRVQDAKYTKSYGLTIDGWFIELHGTLRNCLSSRMDRVIDEVQKDTFENAKVRLCRIKEADVMMPNADNDLFLLFTHFVRHFYKGGFSLRQLCDWCSLMWTYRNEIDSQLLEARLIRAGLVDEWKAFAALAVDNLGMPEDTMPLYEDDELWHKKGEKILDFILKDRKPNKMKDTMATAKIFPLHTMSYLPSIFLNLNRLKIKKRLFGER